MDKVKAICKVLLVDDDEDDCTIFEELLKEIDQNITLVCIHSGSNLKHTVLELRPDLIFLDINMPEVDGIRCLKALKSDQALLHIPVVMYSSSNYSRDIEKAYTNGASLFISKPAKIDLIKKAIKGVLDLNWYRPDEITASHFVEGKYLPFQLN